MMLHMSFFMLSEHQTLQPTITDTIALNCICGWIRIKKYLKGTIY